MEVLLDSGDYILTESDHDTNFSDISYYDLISSKSSKFVGSGRGQGKLCCHLISDSIRRLFYFTLKLSCWCNSLNKKAQKELYERRQ